MPPSGDVEALLRELSSATSWQGPRNEALLSLMRLRGQRIGALLALDGANLHRLPDGGARMILHAKSSRAPFELAVPASAVSLLDAYVKDFNQATLAPGARRIGFGMSGPFWRDAIGAELTYARWIHALKDAAATAGVTVLTSHASRRAFATEAVARVCRSVASLAGNWSNPRRMDDHYVQPSLTRLRTQLANLPAATRPEVAQLVDSPERVLV